MKHEDDRDPAAATALEQLRQRFLALPEPAALDRSETGLACEIQRLRQEIAGRIGNPGACRSCAVDSAGREAPFAGGVCCEQRIAELMTEAELAILRASGCDVEVLTGPCLDGAGCAFRDRDGCSLRSAHRPSPCVAYVCDLLSDELRRRGDLEPLQRDCRRLEDLVLRFSALRAMSPLLRALQSQL